MLLLCFHKRKYCDKASPSSSDISFPNYASPYLGEKKADRFRGPP